MLNGISFHPIVLIVVGALIALFGYKIQKLTLTLVCFALGYTISNAFVPSLVSDSTIIIIINIVIGLIFGGLGLKLEKLAVGVSVAYLVYTALSTYAGYLPFELTQVIQLIIALVCGIAALLMIRPILVLATSIGGVSIFLSGLVSYIVIPGNVYFIVLLLAIIFCAIVQFKTN